MKKKNIAFVWGWSWGHIQPIASLLDYAKQYTNISLQSNRYRFWQEWWLEEIYARRYNEVTFAPVLTWKLRRYWTLVSTWQNIRDIFLIIWGFFQSLYRLKKYRIDVIFCKWWFVCPPVAYAWRLLWIPVLVHESDTHIWLANRLILPISKTVFTWFWWIVDKEEVVGQILSPKLLISKSVELEWIDPTKSVVLVMWWSQWARVLYDTVTVAAEKNDYKHYQYIFLLWTKSAELLEVYSKAWQIWTLWFVTQWAIASLYELSDLCITRWSASSLQEQQLFGIKKWIVPLPYTWWDHQTVNAKRYQKQYGDLWIPQDNRLQENIEVFLLENTWYKKTIKMPTVEQLCSASIRIWKELLK